MGILGKMPLSNFLKKCFFFYWKASSSKMEGNYMPVLVDPLVTEKTPTDGRLSIESPKRDIKPVFSERYQLGCQKK